MHVSSGFVKEVREGKGGAKLLVIKTGKDRKGNERIELFRCWFDEVKAKAAAVQPGAWVNVLFELSAREHNGSIYQDAECRDIVWNEKRASQAASNGGNLVDRVRGAQAAAQSGPADDDSVPF